MLEWDLSNPFVCQTLNKWSVVNDHDWYTYWYKFIYIGLRLSDQRSQTPPPSGQYFLFTLVQDTSIVWVTYVQNMPTGSAFRSEKSVFCDQSDWNNNNQLILFRSFKQNNFICEKIFYRYATLTAWIHLLICGCAILSRN